MSETKLRYEYNGPFHLNFIAPGIWATSVRDSLETQAFYLPLEHAILKGSQRNKLVQKAQGKG